jgi:hypothetical protein
VFVYVSIFVLTAALALLYQLGLRLNKILYAPALIYLGIFGGLRFEVGQDWPGYQAFFDSVDIDQNPITAYFGNLLNLQFEYGYYLLNWLVKWMGLGYWVVTLVAALFCSYAFYRFTRRYPGNKFYILTIYVGYSFLILNFAQVRQSIAVGFFLLACDYYLEHRNRLRTLGIASLGLFFQYSSIIYILFLAIVMWWPKRKSWGRLLTLCLLGLACLIPLVVNPYALVSHFAPIALQFKLDIYQGDQQAHGGLLVLYAVYLVGMICYFNYYRKVFDDQFLFRYAMLSLGVSALLIFVFPGSYVMYSRGYVVASIFQAFAATFIFRNRKHWGHQIVFAVSLAVSFVYYSRLLTLYSDEYIPYRWVVSR